MFDPAEAVVFHRSVHLGRRGGGGGCTGGSVVSQRGVTLSGCRGNREPRRRRARGGLGSGRRRWEVGLGGLWLSPGFGRGLAAQLRLGGVLRVQGGVVDHLAEARLVLLDLQLQADPPASLVGLDGRFADPLRERVIVVGRRRRSRRTAEGGDLTRRLRRRFGRRGGRTAGGPGHRRPASALLYDQFGWWERGMRGRGWSRRMRSWSGIRSRRRVRCDIGRRSRDGSSSYRSRSRN